MANQKRKLESFLKQPNPKVCNTYSWEGSLTETRGSSPQAADMVAWPDFEYKNLIGKFCRFLNHEYDNQYLPVFGESLPFHLTEVRNEDTLEALLIRWNHAVVSTALELAQRKSNSTISDPDTDPEEIFMARGGHGWIPDTNVTQKGCHPDWAGIQRSKPEEIKVGGQKRVSYVNMLPGDSKLSTKWNTKLYCLRARAQFGYLITQEELVACHISYRLRNNRTGSRVPQPQTIYALDQRSQRARGSFSEDQMSLPAAAEQQQKARDFEPIVEYKSIGWEVDGIKTPHKLTMNLGLWCLHMMARNDGFLHKPGECSDSMSPSASFSNDETKKRKGVGSFSKSTGSSLDRARKRRKIDDGSFRSDTTMASV